MAAKSETSEKTAKEQGKKIAKNVTDRKSDVAKIEKSPQSSTAESEVNEVKLTSEAKIKPSPQTESDNSALLNENKSNKVRNPSNKATPERMNQTAITHDESTVLATSTSGSLTSFFHPVLMFVRSETFLALAKRVWLTLLCEVIVTFISKVSRKCFNTNYKRIPNQSVDPNLTPFKTTPVYVIANGDSGSMNKGSSSAPGPNGPTQVPGISVDEFIRQLSLATRKTSNSGRDSKLTDQNSGNFKSVSKRDKERDIEDKILKNQHPGKKEHTGKDEKCDEKTGFLLEPIGEDEKGNVEISEPERVRQNDGSIDDFISNLNKASKTVTKISDNSGEHTYQSKYDNAKDKGEITKQSKNLESFLLKEGEGKHGSPKQQSWIVPTGEITKAGENNKNKNKEQGKRTRTNEEEKHEDTKSSGFTEIDGIPNSGSVATPTVESKKMKGESSKLKSDQAPQVNNNKERKDESDKSNDLATSIGENVKDKSNEQEQITINNEVENEEGQKDELAKSRHSIALSDENRNGKGEDTKQNGDQSAQVKNLKERKDETAQTNGLGTSTVENVKDKNNAQEQITINNEDENEEVQKDELAKSRHSTVSSDENRNGEVEDTKQNGDQSAQVKNNEERNDEYAKLNGLGTSIGENVKDKNNEQGKITINNKDEEGQKDEDAKSRRSTSLKGESSKRKGVSPKPNREKAPAVNNNKVVKGGTAEANDIKISTSGNDKDQNNEQRTKTIKNKDEEDKKDEFTNSRHSTESSGENRIGKGEDTNQHGENSAQVKNNNEGKDESEKSNDVRTSTGENVKDKNNEQGKITISNKDEEGQKDEVAESRRSTSVKGESRKGKGVSPKPNRENAPPVNNNKVVKGGTAESNDIKISTSGHDKDQNNEQRTKTIKNKDEEDKKDEFRKSRQSTASSGENRIGKGEDTNQNGEQSAQVKTNNEGQDESEKSNDVGTSTGENVKDKNNEQGKITINNKDEEGQKDEDAKSRRSTASSGDNRNGKGKDTDQNGGQTAQLKNNTKGKDKFEKSSDLVEIIEDKNNDQGSQIKLNEQNNIGDSRPYGGSASTGENRKGKGENNKPNGDQSAQVKRSIASYKVVKAQVEDNYNPLGVDHSSEKLENVEKITKDHKSKKGVSYPKRN